MISQPILEPMFFGKTVTLNVEQQLCIGAWLTKTAMVFECLKVDAERFYLRDECRHLFQKGTPPPSVIGIWLARYSGAEHSVFTLGTNLRGIVEEDDSDVEGYAFTIAIGSFVGQVMSVRHEMDIAVPVLDLADPAERGIHIRPPILPTVDWPSPIPLDDGSNGLEAFCKRFIGS